MRKKIRKHLHDGEELLHVEIPSWMKYHKEIALSPLVFPLIHAVLRKYSTHLVITNDRVIARHGIIGEHSKGVKFDNITTIRVHQSAIGAIMNYGHIHVYTQSGGHADLTFHFIKNPITVKKAIENGMNLRKSLEEE